MDLCACWTGGCLLGVSSESAEEATEACISRVAMGGFATCYYKKFEKSDE